ncbi:MAG: serine/threonine-protein kinase [Streptosporangiaceae bacterium]
MTVQDRTPDRLGPYRLIRRLGEGGMGVVYLAADAAERPVAVKALRPALAQDESARRRLAREVAAMRLVRSRYVAEVIDAELEHDVPYIVTRFVPGLTLDAVVSAGGPLTGQALARVARGLAHALAAVHEAGVVHRDLKPANVMISDGDPVVIDFGIAQLAETTRLTMTGMFMGTPGYLAPEVIEGNHSSPASDVHSWGATVAYAATGRPPFGAGSVETIFYRVMHCQPDLDMLPVPLRSPVGRALSRDPALRPSAAELTALADVLDAQSLVPGPSSAMGGPAAAGGPAPPGGPAVALGALPRTVASPSDWPGSPHSTMPLTTTGPAGEAGPQDLRDLLPPVRYAPAGPVGDGASFPAYGAWPDGAWPDGAWPDGALSDGALPDGLAPYGPAAVGPDGTMLAPVPLPAGTGQAPAGPGRPGIWPGGAGPAGPGQDAIVPPAAALRPVTARSPLVLAVIAILVAASVLAPLAGTAVALAVLVAFRAAGITVRQLARRRDGETSRVGLAAVGAALYPLALVRALFRMVLLAPVAALAFAVVAGGTVVAMASHPLPHAMALGAGALVAMVGLGPGSAGSRRALAGAFTAVARTRAQRVVAYSGMIALAAWAITTAWYLPSDYWPIGNAHAQLMHLPTVRSVLTGIRLSLLRLAHRFGL